MYLDVALFGFVLFGTPGGPWAWKSISTPQVLEKFSYYAFRYGLFPFLFLFSLWNLYNVNVTTLDVVPEAT